MTRSVARRIDLTAASQSLQPAAPTSSPGGMMELLIGFVTTLFISLLIFRT
jgi:capsular polysaccharide biosynthesis protein